MELLRKKIVVEFRYRPLLNFPEVANREWQDIIQNYDEISQTSNSLTFKSSKRYVEIFHTNEHSGIRLENIEDTRIIQAELKIILDLLRECKILNFYRLGIRTWSLFPIGDSFQSLKDQQERKGELIKIYADYMLKSNNTVLSTNLGDFVITEEGLFEENNIRVQSGIVDNLELQQKLVTTFAHEDPTLSLLYDIDQFVTEKDSTIGAARIMKMITNNFKLSIDHLKGNHELFD